MSNPPVQFDIGSYTDVYGPSNLGGDLWEWLWRSENLARMGAACDCNKPAVQALQHELQKDFGLKLTSTKTNEFHRIKMMIGQMVKQILLHEGFDLIGTNYKVTTGNLFTRGAKYTRK